MSRTGVENKGATRQNFSLISYVTVAREFSEFDEVLYSAGTLIIHSSGQGVNFFIGCFLSP